MVGDARCADRPGAAGGTGAFALCDFAGRAPGDRTVVSAALPAVLMGLAVAVAGAPSRVPVRLARVLPASSARPRQRTTRTSRWSGPGASCAFAGLAALLLVGGAAGVVLGLAVALGGPHALGRLEPRAARETRERIAADLPLALDLLSACLTGGAALPDAVRVVGGALAGPVGRRLVAVAAALDVGTPPVQAWAGLTGGDPDGFVAAAVRVLGRAGDGGTPVAAAVARLAGEAREDRRAQGLAAAERAGVLAVAPLGLCFLPAFVLLGVVPVVVGLVTPLLAGL